MDKKKQHMENLSDFRSHQLFPRSAKPEFKPIVVKKDTMDEQTRHERNYLGPELHAILQA